MKYTRKQLAKINNLAEVYLTLEKQQDVIFEIYNRLKQEKNIIFQQYWDLTHGGVISEDVKK